MRFEGAFGPAHLSIQLPKEAAERIKRAVGQRHLPSEQPLDSLIGRKSAGMQVLLHRSANYQV